MLSNRIALAVLAALCIGAAAGGGYLATRQATPAAAASNETAFAARQNPPAVEATESVVTPPAEAPKPAEPPAPAQKPAQRRPADRPVQNAKAVTAKAPEAPPLDHSWPANSSAPPPTMPPAVPIEQAPPFGQASDNHPANDPVPAPEPQRTFEELIVAADSVIGLKLDGALSSERAHVEDAVEARVIRDVRVGRSVAIPAGARALGSVVVVERGGKFKDRARLGIRFHTLVLADGSRLPISTDTIYRYGDAPGDGTAKKVGGGAVAGAILGAILGGAKGAAIGATAGAGGGTAVVMAGDRSAAEFPAGSDVTARMLSPVTVTVDR